MNAVIYRGVILAVFWVALAGTAPSDLAAGLLAVVAAARVSVRLLPPAGSLGAGHLDVFAFRFARQSVRAGVEVARLAFGSTDALRPGLVGYRTNLPEGTRRDAFTALLSLQPGALPIGATGGNQLHLHCLVVGTPVLSQLAADEAAFASIFREGPRA